MGGELEGGGSRGHLSGESLREVKESRPANVNVSANCFFFFFLGGGGSGTV